MPAIKRHSANTTCASRRRTKRQKTGFREDRQKDDRQGDERPSEDDQTIENFCQVTLKNRRKHTCYINGCKADELSHVEEECSEWNGDFHENKTGNKFWPAERILRETETLYLIAWEPSSETGQRFEPTWEPKQNANKDLSDEWERKKMQKKREMQDAKQAANISEDAGEADSAELSPVVTHTIDATSPNLTPELATSLKSYQNVFTYDTKQRRLPQRQSWDVHHRESAESE